MDRLEHLKVSEKKPAANQLQISGRNQWMAGNWTENLLFRVWELQWKSKRKNRNRLCTAERWRCENIKKSQMQKNTSFGRLCTCSLWLWEAWHRETASPWASSGTAARLSGCAERRGGRRHIRPEPPAAGRLQSSLQTDINTRVQLCTEWTPRHTTTASMLPTDDWI